MESFVLFSFINICVYVQLQYINKAEFIFYREFFLSYLFHKALGFPVRSLAA